MRSFILIFVQSHQENGQIKKVTKGDLYSSYETSSTLYNCFAETELDHERVAVVLQLLEDKISELDSIQNKILEASIKIKLQTRIYRKK